MATKMLKARLFSVPGRTVCSWVNAQQQSTSSEPQPLEIEQLFFDKKVQKLLKGLTGVEPRRVLAGGMAEKDERTHFQLMTEEELKRVNSRLAENAKRLMQFPPMLSARKDAGVILSEEPEIEGFDTANFVFTDITFGLTTQDRMVVVREPNGCLRTATVEEHDRMERLYFSQPDKPVKLPPIFDLNEPHLAAALSRQQHKQVLDYACYYFEPDHPHFIRVVKVIYDDVYDHGHFEVIAGTRHNGGFLLYLVVNKKLNRLLMHYLRHHSSPINSILAVIELYETAFPHCASKSKTESDATSYERLSMFLQHELPDDKPLIEAVNAILQKSTK